MYVILHVLGLDAVAEQSLPEPEWRAYLDPYICSERGFLDFHTPTYVVTAAQQVGTV